MFVWAWQFVCGCQSVSDLIHICEWWVMVAAAACRQDVRVHKHVGVFLHVCVSASQSVCPWLLMASACIQVLLGSRALHVHECESVCVFCVRGGDYRSKSACYSWVGATAFSLCLGPSLFVDKRMLWDKWFSTCQSEQKDERWEKKEVRDAEGEDDGGFQTNSEGSRGEKGEGENEEGEKIFKQKEKLKRKWTI